MGAPGARSARQLSERSVEMRPQLPGPVMLGIYTQHVADAR